MLILEWLKYRLRGLPWGVIIVAYMLIGLGLVNLYSATGAHANPARFNDQLNWVMVGTLAMIFWGLIVDLRTTEKITVLGYIIVCLMLVAVDISGQVAKGSQRWLRLGPIALQPSELTKVIVILITARTFSAVRGITEFSLFSLWRQILVIGIPSILILMQPDLGTAGLVVLIAGLQLCFVRIEWKSIAAVVVGGVTTLFVAWNFLLYDYQKLRVLNFLNPMNDPKGSGYHSIQSMIAVGSGGLWGKGFRHGTQAHLSFLPERHTDFIFSVLAEEHGFMGCLVIFFLYLMLILFIFQIAERARDTFSSMIAIGIAGFFIFHFVINTAMVLGLFPVVGVPLSLVSYGGSHMLTTMTCIGLLIAIERKRTITVK